MKKIYQAPQTSICALMSHGPISVSMKIGTMEEKVNSTSDIGFTKEYDFDEDELWDD